MKKMIAILVSIAMVCMMRPSAEKAQASEATILAQADAVPAVVNRVRRGDGEGFAPYSADDLFVLSHVITGEAGSWWLTDEEQLLVANVVMNRVASPLFPNTIREVVFQPGQYACTWDGNYEREPDARTMENARRILNGERFCPENVLYQSNSRQGEVYKQIGETYFCYG